jgi:hypothetical protein
LGRIWFDEEGIFGLFYSGYFREGFIMRFSERIGKKQVRQELQVDGIDAPLRNCLWDIVSSFILCKISDDRFTRSLTSESYGLAKTIYHSFFKKALNEVPNYASGIGDQIYKWFFEAEWYEIYDFLEFIQVFDGDIDVKEFRRVCNSVLENEHSGYRFVENQIAPIVNTVEIQAVEQAIDGCSVHQFDGARKHFGSALEKLSDRPNPDYRNSIKESVSAVESVCAIISSEPKATLGQALKKIKDMVGLHPALEKGMSSIYGYTSDAEGIRHAMTKESDCDLADAKYMLVSCSAFVNYLIMKANKAGLIDKD